MSMTRSGFFVLFALCACDGPYEDAGEGIDAARGDTGGTSSIVSGPAERRGEALDRQAGKHRKPSGGGDAATQGSAPH